MIRSPALSSCVLILGLAWSLPAQQVPAGRAGVDAAIVRLSARLQESPEFVTYVSDPANQASGNPLAPTGSLSFLPLDDSTTIGLLSLLNDTLAQLPEPSCAAIVNGKAGLEGDGFMDWLGASDSATVERWVTLLGDVALLTVRRAPPHPKPSAEEGQQVLVAALSTLSEADQARLATAFESGQASEQCWAARQLFGGLGRQPPADQVRAMRSFFP